MIKYLTYFFMEQQAASQVPLSISVSFHRIDDLSGLPVRYAREIL